MSMVTKDWVLFEHIGQSRRQGIIDVVFDRFGQVVLTGLFAVLAFVLASPPPSDVYHSWIFWLVLILTLIDVVAAYVSKASGH